MGEAAEASDDRDVLLGLLDPHGGDRLQRRRTLRGEAPRLLETPALRCEVLGMSQGHREEQALPEG